MPNRTPAIVAAVLTAIFLVLFSVPVLFFQMVALNGASERQGVTAMGLSLVCQGVGIILSVLLAGWLTSLTITKFNWSTTVAAMVAVIAGTFVGGLLSFLSIIIALPIAGIR